MNTKTVLQACVILLLISYTLINAMLGSFTLYEISFWQLKEHNADLINQQFDIVNQSSVLYLDPGDGPYYFHANSSCHYITPMPVERSTTKWDLSWLPQNAETYNCIMNYKGEYIIADIRTKTGFYGEGIAENKSIITWMNATYKPMVWTSWMVFKRYDCLTAEERNESESFTLFSPKIMNVNEL
jgi:hypothetical protein